MLRLLVAAQEFPLKLKLMKKQLLFTLLVITLLYTFSACQPAATQATLTSKFGSSVYDDGLNFYVANDLGRNGYFKQKPIAELMGNMADSLDIEFVALAGDCHHFNGVQSTADPLWMTNFETIYSHPDLMIDWFPILGNHEYRGNTDAVLDYSKISRRWVMPARYYTKVIPETDDHASLTILFIDTTPLMKEYWSEPDKYPDVQKQDTARQLAWMDSVLTVSATKFNIVIGHHPIYVSEKKRADAPSLIASLDPILRKHQVDFYIAGHSHTFQHLRKEGSVVNCVVNASASLGREPIKGPDTQFCSSDEGFSVMSLGKNELKMSFINYKGEAIHQIVAQK